MEESSFLAKKVLDFKKVGKLLDIGAGYGEDSVFFAKKGFSVSSLDSLPIAIHNTKQLSEINSVKLNIINANIETYQLTENYDVIFSNLTFHFLSKDSFNTIIEKIKAHTNAEGINAISYLNNKISLNKSIKEFYSDWEVLFYQEQDNTVNIIARKPS